MNLTIEIPDVLERMLQSKAAAEGKSISQFAVDALASQLGLSNPPVVHHDLDWFIGGKFIDDDTMKAIEESRVVHPDD